MTTRSAFALLLALIATPSAAQRIRACPGPDCLSVQLEAPVLFDPILELNVVNGGSSKGMYLDGSGDIFAFEFPTLTDNDRSLAMFSSLGAGRLSQFVAEEHLRRRLEANRKHVRRLSEDELAETKSLIVSARRGTLFPPYLCAFDAGAVIVTSYLRASTEYLLANLLTEAGNNCTDNSAAEATALKIRLWDEFRHWEAVE